MTPTLVRVADALEHATDLLERQCECEYEHGPECLAHGWRALVREAREQAEQEQHTESEAAA